MADGIVSVGLQGRGKVALLSAEDGKPLDGEAVAEAGKKFYRFRNHICTPVMRVGDFVLNNRGGNLSKPGEDTNFGGARAACLTGTVPAYGAGYIAQNWCRCSPAQIAGLIAIGPIGKMPTAEEMEKAVEPIACGKYSDGDAVASSATWTSARGDCQRGSSAACDIPGDVDVVWQRKVAEDIRPGTVQRDWLSYLNSRLTAPVLTDELAIVGDIDHNEIVAVSLEDGSVKWRFTTGARVDSAPTLYKGICLIGDHSGYVYAVKINGGELIYKARIAPEEKRMLSYGKVESVWPVIGGVMVADGRAYATAGRSQGSDGGLIVRAFQPETGKQIWAKALPLNGPELVQKRPKRNDMLTRQGKHLMVMEHWLDLETGKICPKPEVPATLTTGLEGVYSWNWTRVGHRKFGRLGYGGANGNAISWNDKYAAASNHNGGGTIVNLGKPAEKKAFQGEPRVYLATCMVLCNNVLLQGGAICDQQDDKGFIRAISLEDGKVVWEQKFDTQLAFNGLAVDKTGIVASFNDGSVARLK